jgi:hypothetical protein
VVCGLTARLDLARGPGTVEGCVIVGRKACGVRRDPTARAATAHGS